MKDLKNRIQEFKESAEFEFIDKDGLHNCVDWCGSFSEKQSLKHFGFSKKELDNCEELESWLFDDEALIFRFKKEEEEKGDFKPKLF